MPERIPEEGWRHEAAHVERYEWAAQQIHPGETVLDIACGIGYGAEVMWPSGCRYIGVDRPGVISPTFGEFGGMTFIETNIDTWDGPAEPFDVAVCFETLEHVHDPGHLASICARATRLVLVSVPTVPTVGTNPWHLHDFTEVDVAPLFPTLTLTEVIPQPSAASHLFVFEA